MSYTAHDYLNKIIQIAIDDGTVTKDEMLRLVEAYGSNDDQIVIDILSMVYQRRKDHRRLEELQTIYRDHRNGLRPK